MARYVRLSDSAPDTSASGVLPRVVVGANVDDREALSDVAVGFALLEEGRATEAAAVARDGLSIRPRSPELLLLLGRALVAVGDLGEARRALLRGTMIAPASSELTIDLAQVMLNLGESDRALRVLRRAVRLGSADDRMGALYARACLASEQSKERRGSAGVTEHEPASTPERVDGEEDWEALLARAKSSTEADGQ